MKRILINATQNEEIRVALCKGNHLYDFDLENRTREQKKSNIYKGHVTRVEPSLEAVFVEYGSQRQGFLPIREISTEYLSGNPRDENIKKLIKEGDELIVQVEKEERGNKGAALSTYVSLAGRYLVLMPNNPRGGGISRQISGKLREDMKRMLGNLDLPKGMSVIIRTAGIGKTQEDLQHDLNHLLNIWQAITEQNKKYPSPRLVHQEAGVVTRAVRDYLRDDISEIWIDNENAYIEAAGFIDAVMPKQAEKLRKYTDYEPMFSRFNIEKQIETAYQREVRLPSGGSIVIDQTEALVSIDINSAKSTKGSDVAATAYHTNLEAADEIARQLRLRDMGGLIVIDFIDMNDNKHQKEVEKRLIDATKYDRARVQFGDISKFGLMEMSRQRLRPSLEESTGYICPRCHGNGMIRDLRSLSLSIMRQIEQIALKERQGEVQAEVPTDIAAFLLNEKRDSLVYLEQDSGTRITILPHAHLESPNFKLHFNRDGFAPSSYERITDTQQQEHSDLGYDVDWQTADSMRPEQQPTRQPRQNNTHDTAGTASKNDTAKQRSASSQNHGNQNKTPHKNSSSQNNTQRNQQQSTDRTVSQNNAHRNQANRDTTNAQASQVAAKQAALPQSAAQPQAVAWLSNLFAQAPQAKTAGVSSHNAAEAIEALVNTGAQSLGSFGQTDSRALSQDSSTAATPEHSQQSTSEPSNNERQATRRPSNNGTHSDDKTEDRRRRKTRKPRPAKSQSRKEQREQPNHDDSSHSNDTQQSYDHNRQRPVADKSDKSDNKRQDERNKDTRQNSHQTNEHTRNKRKPHSQRSSRGALDRGETLDASQAAVNHDDRSKQSEQSRESSNQQTTNNRRNQNPNEVTLQVNEAPMQLKSPEVVHLSLDDSKTSASPKSAHKSKEAQDTNDKKAYANKSQATQVEVQSAENIMAQPNNAKDNTKATAQSHATKSVKNSADSNAAETKAAQEDNKADLASKPDASTAVSMSADDNNAAPKDTAPVVSHEPSSGFDLDHEQLFAARYVTAHKFGQASNDPRVVRHQSASGTKPQAESIKTTNRTVSPASATAISGSVGDFIRASLAKAEQRLADEGVISCFIAAIRAHTKEPSVATEVSDTDSFDFSNYGYEPLSADYLQRFKTMTEATSHTAIEQGKTAVAPRAIDKRASNDPRGQHPDYQEVVESAAPQATLSVPDTANIDTTNADVDAHDVKATALSAATQADAITAESEQLLQVDEAIDDNDLSSQANGDSEQAEKSKTTIASYKNMIENVAEQLLPQTGMFNLTTPKVPKARTRKPKVEHKKPTQAEKSETTNDGADTDTDSDS